MLKMKNKTKDYNSVNWNEIFIEDSSSPTGLKWKINPSKSVKSGDNAGSIWIAQKSDYECFRVKFNKKQWLVHRILYVMRNGSIDHNLYIDHIDGNALNNSAENIRLVHEYINLRNCKKQKNNSSGVTGVWFEIDSQGATYVRTGWYTLSSKRASKSFNCTKLGLLPAFAAACAYREKKIKELNESGAEYSERHGE